MKAKSYFLKKSRKDGTQIDEEVPCGSRSHEGDP